MVRGGVEYDQRWFRVAEGIRVHLREVRGQPSPHVSMLERPSGHLGATLWMLWR